MVHTVSSPFLRGAVPVVGTARGGCPVAAPCSASLAAAEAGQHQAVWPQAVPTVLVGVATGLVAATVLGYVRRDGRRRRTLHKLRSPAIWRRALTASVDGIGGHRRATDLSTAGWKEWAVELGIDSEKLELKLLQDSFGEELRGMVATAPVDTDEALLTVPAEAVLQVTTGGECPTAAVDADCWKRLPWWAQLALLLVSESKKGDESHLASWITTLPRNFASLPMNWTETELRAVSYPALADRVARQRREILTAFEEARQGCQAFELSEEDFRWAVSVVRSRTFSGPYEGRGASDRVQQVLLVAALIAGGVATGSVKIDDALNGAFVALLAIPLTDFFVSQSSSLKRHVLCPVVDYLNHDSSTDSDIAYEYFNNKFAVRVSGGCVPGEQVCINYGERRSNDDLLLYYGFVERNCPHDVYEMDLLEHLDAEAAANGEKLVVKLRRNGLSDDDLGALRRLLATSEDRATDARSGPLSEENERLVWKAVAIACESELQRRWPDSKDGVVGPAASLEIGGMAARFRAEKLDVLRSCHAHAVSRGRRASNAPLSLASGSVITPVFQDAALWRNDWAGALFQQSHAAQLRDKGYCVLQGAFDARLAASCLEECASLDAASRTTVTTNKCNSGSRSVWLEFGSAERSAELQQRGCSSLRELSHMLAGLPAYVNDLGAFDSPRLQVHAATMVAVYPERAAEYAVHKDSYAPKDNDPATGGTRRLTVLAYFNDWQEGHGGELRLYEPVGDKPDKRRFTAIKPSVGTLVLFDSRRVWHAVAPSLHGPRWAMTLWVH